MKKVLRIFGIVLLGFVLLFVAFLFGIKIWNHVAMKGEKELLQNHPGTRVEVDGSSMNLYVEGEGAHTLVFLSGWKVPCPIFEYRPLYSKLSDEYRCVVIEKFGYGFSDGFDGPRDFDTLVRQDREALQKAGMEGPYVLCAHSLSGFEAELWAEKYPEEVEAIIGLDMCLAGCFDPAEDSTSSETQNKLDRIGAFFGINRFLMSISEFEGLSEEEIRQYIAVGCKNLGNSTAAREYEGIIPVFEELSGMPLPKAPTIQYVSGANREKELWVTAHRKFVEASQNGKYVQLECGHYVHNFESDRIAREVKELLDNGVACQ